MKQIFNLTIIVVTNFWGSNIVNNLKLKALEISNLILEKETHLIGMIYQKHLAIDRLHTLMTNQVKELCVNHSITFNENDRLDVIFKNMLIRLKSIDSDMYLTILKSNISLFSQFNNIRNNYMNMIMMF